MVDTAPYDDRDGFIWFDGKLVPWREANVHLLTHALHYASAVFEGERAYEDLFLYRTQVAPQAAGLVDLLHKVTAGQQKQLQAELLRARDSLARSRAQTLAGAGVALAAGLVLAYLLRRRIVGPVQRLTEVAARIAAGWVTEEELEKARTEQAAAAAAAEAAKAAEAAAAVAVAKV